MGAIDAYFLCVCVLAKFPSWTSRVRVPSPAPFTFKSFNDLHASRSSVRPSYLPTNGVIGVTSPHGVDFIGRLPTEIGRHNRRSRSFQETCCLRASPTNRGCRNPALIECPLKWTSIPSMSGSERRYRHTGVMIRRTTLGFWVGQWCSAMSTLSVKSAIVQPGWFT
jgi:hypothetical protein